MKRRTFDLIVSWVGVVLAVVFVVAGVLLIVGYSFANSQVTENLTAQKVYFPPKGDPQLDDPKIGPYLTPYSTPVQTLPNGQKVGQQLTTGRQAQVYADHYIAVHLEGVANGQTYSEVSGQYIACTSTPGSCSADKTATLAQQRETLFQGETLRGLLLNAYAFWTFGQIALWAAIAAFLAAVVLAILAILGFRHLGKTPESEEVGAGHPSATDDGAEPDAPDGREDEALAGAGARASREASAPQSEASDASEPSEPADSGGG